MIIKRAYLKNIRSYAEANFCFSPNTTLIEGDVGAGKTTLLMAISFALFGNSVERRILSKLLKKDAEQGVVVVEIEHLSHNYTISRAIERKKAQTAQGEVYIIDDNKKTLLSPTELNARIATIFNIKNIGNSASIFYIPQDEIKQILYSNEEERMSIIRSIFDIKKYQQCKENEKYVERDIRQSLVLLKKDIEVLDEIKKQKTILKQEKETLELENKKQNSKITELKHALSDINSKYEKVQKELADQQANNQKILEIKKNLAFLEKNKQDLATDLNKLLEKIEQCKTQIKPRENAEILESKLKEIRNQKDKINQQTTQFQTRLEETDKQRKMLIDEMDNQKRVGGEAKKKIVECQKYINEIKERYFKIFNEKADVEKIKKIPYEKEILQKELEKITEERESLKGKEHELKTMLKNLDEQKRELLEANGMCPTCESSLPDNKKANLLKNIEQNNEEITKKLKETESKIKEKEIEKSKKEIIIKGADSINNELFVARHNELSELNKAIEEQKEKTNKIENENKEIDEKQKYLNNQIKQKQQDLTLTAKEETEIVEKIEISKSIDALIEKIKILEEQKENEILRQKQIMDEIQKAISGAREIMLLGATAVVRNDIEIKVNPLLDETLKNTQNEKQRIQSQIEKEQYFVGKTEQRIADIKKDLEKQMRNELVCEEQKKMKEQKELLLYWINHIFIETLNSIETAVTTEILKNFNELFKKYFKIILQNEEFSAEIDQKFTPVFFVGNNNFSFEDLSGGEKTAAALSYYLTLALLLEKYGISALKGVMILDEPTTGFGSEQIQNMQDVFSSLPLKQIIIVSHETTLEKSVQHVIKVCKVDKQSYIVC